MLSFDLQKQGNVPLYEALYRAIRDEIISGGLTAGEKLPSKRALSLNMNISVTTIENSYAQLCLEGYIHSEPGRGFFVNDLPETDKESLEYLYGAEDEEYPFIPPEEEEPHYRIDFKSNMSAMSLFPFSVWSRLMREVVSSRNPELLVTGPYNGLYSLRKAIADHLHSYRGMNVNPDQIIVGAGTEYLYSRILALFGTGNVIAIEDPGYKKFADISGSQGCIWDYIPIDEFGMRSDLLKRSRANLAHVSPANHFPTGYVMPIARRMEMLEWAHSSPINYLIEDDYDSELRYSGKAIPPLYKLDKAERVIYLNTFSKSLVPSLRISYAVLPPKLILQYRERLSFYSCTVSSFEQLTLARFISQGHFERHINRLKQHYRNKRDLLISAIAASPLSKIGQIREAEAGTHFLLRMNTALDDAQIHAAADEKGIRLALLSDYAKAFSIRNSRTLVINYAGLDPKQTEEAVSILEEIFCAPAAVPLKRNAATDLTK